MKKQTKMWIQNCGTKIRICDMSDDYLIDTIWALYRVANTYYHNRIHAGESILKVLQTPIEENLGDMFMFRSGLEVHPHNYILIYSKLVKDAERRKLYVRVPVEPNMKRER